MKLKRILTGVLAAVMFSAGSLAAAQTTRLSIGTGGTGGVYYPMGGGMAAVLSKHVPGWEATAEVTGASVANLQLIGQGKQDIGFTMADAAYDAVSGLSKFKDRKVEARTLIVLYPNKMHVVTTEGSGIEKLADFKGKRVSVGEPNSGTEVMAMRLLEAAGVGTSFNRERLSVAEGVNAIKDRKIDALIWVGGLPTAAITDLATTPGMTVKLLDHAEYADALNQKWGPLYVKGTIPANTYKGQGKDVANLDVWNLLVADAKMSDEMAYTIVKTLFEHKDELVAVHREAENIQLEAQAAGSPIPMHPGARKYYEERGLKFER
jgi:TRAP transporter TAXI family solute receptor